MIFKGKIKNIDKIIISDPSYDEDVSCRYERNNINSKDWKIDIEIHSVEDKITDDFTLKGKEFFILLGKPNHCFPLRENGSFAYHSKNVIERYDIGIDTACVALGINEYADEIKDSIGIWQPECSLKTLSDGIFGIVKVIR